VSGGRGSLVSTFEVLSCRDSKISSPFRRRRRQRGSVERNGIWPVSTLHRDCAGADVKAILIFKKLDTRVSKMICLWPPGIVVASIVVTRSEYRCALVLRTYRRNIRIKPAEILCIDFFFRCAARITPERQHVCVLANACHWFPL
jgi:hypothetical protein